MKSELMRAVERTRKIYRGAKRLICDRARAVAITMVLSLLVASLPVSAGTAGRQHTQNDASVATQLSFYGRFTRVLTSIGGWLKNYVNAKPPVNTYRPVVAYFDPPPPFIDAPTNLTVTATASGSVSLSWTAPAGGADHYEVERSASVSGPFFFLKNVTGTSTIDDTVSAQHAYLYRVRAVNSGGLASMPSNMALGTAITFEFSSLLNKEVKAQHFHDVRTAINAVRAVAGQPPASWARGTLSSLEVKADDVSEMRTALDAALGALNIPVPAYQDATLIVGVTPIRAIHIEQLQTRSTQGSSTSSGPLDPDSSSARLDPMNETGGGGENPLSRNFNWDLPLVSLPGRAGLDLNLTLSYNSLVWTKVGTTAISFDDDNGFPGPGFRLGFPVIQPLYHNAEVGKDAFLLIGSDGSRTELRQVGSSALYEAGDSSHLLLDSSTMILRTTDGTQMTYALDGGEYKCSQIKDRNGNYISANYNQGRLSTITDTLGRVIAFNYDSNGLLTSITQVWNQGSANEVTHYWARFEYVNTLIHINFPGLAISGPPDNTNITTLSRVKLADDSYFDFSYSSWGQVYKVSSFAPDNHLLQYRFYNLPQTAGTGLEHDDCPRFTERRDWAQYWNGDTEGTPATSEEALTAFAIPASTTWTMPDDTTRDGMRAQVTMPDGTSNKLYFISSPGWQRGLPALVDTYASGGSLPVRRVMTTWTQDNMAVSFPLNPRVTETNVYDEANKRARTETTYQQFTFGNGTSCNFPQDVYEYAGDATTKLRSTRTVYHTGTTYSDRRILGLATEKQIYEGDVNPANLKSRVGYFYDNENGASSIQGTDAPVQHDNTNYNSNFGTGRANLSSIKRYDVNSSAFTVTTSTYNTAGSLVASKDASEHQIVISYADSFSDNSNDRNTLAYPTTVTDHDGYSSTSKYHFDFGSVTYKRMPLPNVTSNNPGPVKTFAFDVIGRLQQVTNLVNNSYTRFEYATNRLRVDTYSTIQDGLGEAPSFNITDGAGRVIATATDHPGSVGGFSGQKIVYDVMGRVIKTSNPTETSASGAPSQWNAIGDDQTADWVYTEQTYDWKGRPLVTTNQDGTTKTASYSSCGCAGDEVVTVTDEGTVVAGAPKRRQQKIYSDVLGRTAKTEILNWEGGSVYTAIVSTYNALDQVTQSRQYTGPEGSGTYQDTTMTYDGYGRLSSRHVPEQGDGTATIWAYNADDTVQMVTDARGATCTYAYNNGRHLVNTITHALSGTSTIIKTFTYDAVGNRKSALQTIGGVARDSATYEYDQLSRMTSETKHIYALEGNPTTGGNYQMSYTYTLSDQLESVTDSFGAPTLFSRDRAGRTLGVTGTFAGVNYTYASNVGYRASGDVKTALIGGMLETISYNKRLAPTQFRLGTGSANQMRYDYSYFDDGRLKEFKDLDDQIGDPHFVQFHYMSRAYSYDQVGRTSAVGQLENYGVIPPFTGNYGYDSFDNMTSRSGQFALGSFQSDTASYTKNRRNGWSYNPEGQISLSTDNSDNGGSSTRTWTYDAAGTLISSSEIRNGLTTTNSTSYDADGELLAESIDGSVRNYLIHSTVLGAVLTRLTASGGKDITYAPADGLVAPMQNQNPGFSPFLSVVYRDALGIQEQQSNSQFTFYAYDPLGSPIPNTQPPLVGTPPYVPFYGSTWGGASWSSFSLANNLATGCNYRGVPTDCNTAMIQTMGLAFAANLPGAQLDLALTEQLYAGYVKQRFAAADEAKRKKAPPKLKPPRKRPTPQQRKKQQQQQKQDLARIRNSEELSPKASSDGQLSPCIRELLRPFFPKMMVHGRSYSPVDDARFKAGIPAILNVYQDNAAVTLGIYDIHYDPDVLDLSGGEFYDLKTIVEEVSHTVQFLQLWARSKEPPGGNDPGYGQMKQYWGARYLAYAAKGLAQNWDGYKNDIEKWAKNNVVDILSPIKAAEVSRGNWSLCGYSLSGDLSRPDW